MATSPRKLKGKSTRQPVGARRANAVVLPMPELIRKKREGQALSSGEIDFIIQQYAAEAIPDYQLAALCMAVFFRGMADQETTSLTLAMRDSGETLDLSGVPGFKIDKHSTGGVGDKVSICLAPLVASCGVCVPMMSGRGLGHTGGTLDKLEAIPGFSTHLPKKQLLSQLKRIGVAMIGQSQTLAPADKKLYALRDVTATVESIPLITASILSKKLAEGIDGLVLDVKVGRGAFMKTLDDARLLARSLVRVGRQAKKRVTALLTQMDSPLGLAIGNALETREAIAMLHGAGPDDLRECTLELGAHMLRLAQVTRSTNSARRMLVQAINSGEALQKMQTLVAAQGGDPRVVSEPDRLRPAAYKIALVAPTGGYIQTIDAMQLGLAVNRLGAGRLRVEDVIDPSVGMTLQRKPGDRINKGDCLAHLHVQNPKVDVSDFISAFEIGATPSSPTPLVLERVQ